MPRTARHDFDALIIGAGAAGLSAACELQAAGQGVCVVEARSRVGGRIATARSGDCVMELGAEFVHGKDPLLWALLQEARIKIIEVDGAQLCATDAGIIECPPAHDATFYILDKIDPKLSPDQSFKNYLDATKASPQESEAAIAYVEGFNAAEAGRISARSLAVQQRAENAINGDKSWRIAGGYSLLTAHLERKLAKAAGELLLDTIVDAIDWRRDHCTISAHNDAGLIKLNASRVVVAVPLGVLQQRSIAFNPAPAALAAADRMAMGAAHRIVLRFKTAFWKEGSARNAELRELSFLFVTANADNPLQVWWTPHPDDSPILTGWCGGSHAVAQNDQLHHFHGAAGERALIEGALNELARIFNRDAPWLRGHLLESHFHNWSDDLFARGAYSYVLAGALDAPFAMAAPVEGTLFFAGEHTDMQGHWGTVHAALASGYRAARQILHGDAM